jgi:hypothetical protein
MEEILVTQFVACLSGIGCLIMIALFHLKSAIKVKKVNHIIYRIAICDLFASIGIALGEPRDRTVLCWIQSIMTSYFPLVSVFLTTLIAFILFAAIRKISLDSVAQTKIYVICWVVPLILTFLPLSTNQYGNPGENKGWCFLDTRKGSPNWTLSFWIVVSFYLWFYLAIVIYLILLWSVICRLSVVYGIIAEIHGPRTSSVAHYISRSLMSLIWYPLIILVCWSPSALWDISEALHEAQWSTALDSRRLNFFPASQGALTAMAFILTNLNTLQGLSEEGGNEVEGQPASGSPFFSWIFRAQPSSRQLFDSSALVSGSIASQPSSDSSDMQATERRLEPNDAMFLFGGGSDIYKSHPQN